MKEAEDKVMQIAHKLLIRKKDARFPQGVEFMLSGLSSKSKQARTSTNTVPQPSTTQERLPRSTTVAKKAKEKGVTTLGKELNTAKNELITVQASYNNHPENEAIKELVEAAKAKVELAENALAAKKIQMKEKQKADKEARKRDLATPSSNVQTADKDAIIETISLSDDDVEEVLDLVSEQDSDSDDTSETCMILDEANVTAPQEYGGIAECYN
jgi:hypothetical protein